MRKWRVLLACLTLLIGLKVCASGQFLKVDGQIINRMAIVSVGKVQKPCITCICSYSSCDKWHFLVFPTTNPRDGVTITGSSFNDIQAKHKRVEDWLILGK